MISKSEAGRLGYEKNKAFLLSRSAKMADEARRRYEKSPKLCKQCGHMLPYEDRANTYCNHSCAAKYANGRRKTKRCQCGVTIARHRSYCEKCRAAGFGSNRCTLETAQTDAARRRCLVRMRGHRCEECGLSEWLGKPIPLQLDHLDGNSDNNSEGNLRLLCPNCHALTPNFMGRNKNNKNSKRNVLRRARYHGTKIGSDSTRAVQIIRNDPM